jgi:hypothetical protein
MGSFQRPDSAAGQTPDAAADESLIILQSLLCVLREKNLLTRADMEELCHKVDLRAVAQVDSPLPCCPERASAASSLMHRLTSYMGQRYGGKHARGFRDEG